MGCSYSAPRRNPTASPSPPPPTTTRSTDVIHHHQCDPHSFIDDQQSHQDSCSIHHQRYQDQELQLLDQLYTKKKKKTKRSIHHHHRLSSKRQPLWLLLAATAAEEAEEDEKPTKRRSSASCTNSNPVFKQKKKKTKKKVVLYTTSLRGIRGTHDDCCSVRSILQGHRIAFDERDLSMDASFKAELSEIMDCRNWTLPQLVVGGELVGGAEEVRRLHEDGQLARVLQGADTVVDPGSVCAGCGGARFVPCQRCWGSRKVFVEEEGRVRRCRECNENGLVRCRLCVM